MPVLAGGPAVTSKRGAKAAALNTRTAIEGADLSVDRQRPRRLQRSVEFEPPRIRATS